MRDVLDEIVQKQQRYSASDRRHDEKNGQQRAVITDPGMAAIAVSQLVEEVLRDAELDAASYGKAEAAERARLKADFAHHDTRLAQELYIERHNAENERQQDLANLDAEFGDGSPTRATLTERARSAEDALAAVKARVTPRRRPLRTHWRAAFLPLMLLIALIEMPLNQLSFEFVLRDIPAFSWLLALACGVILVFFAHLIGVWTRQLNPAQRKPLSLFAASVSIASVSSIATYLIYIIAGLRQRYVNHASAPDATMADGILADQSTLDQIARTVTAAATDTTLSSLGWLIFGINIVFFSFGVLLAYYRHDPDPDYERAEKNNDNAKQALKTLQDKYQHRKNLLNENFNAHQAQLNEEIGDAESRLEGARDALDSLDNRRLPDLRVIATCALARAAHRLTGFYQRAAERGARLNVYELPDVHTLMARFEAASQGAAREHPQAAHRYTAPPPGGGLNAGRPQRPTGPHRDNNEAPGAMQ